jgi:hypothetical protein
MREARGEIALSAKSRCTQDQDARGAPVSNPGKTTAPYHLPSVRRGAE